MEGRLGLLEVKRRQSSAVKRIVARCVDSCEDLDLGDCGLTQLPEDIFLLLRPRKLIRSGVNEISLVYKYQSWFSNQKATLGDLPGHV